MLYDKLKTYSKSGVYPFHMPGHKRRNTENSLLPYRLDITEIDGFDNLHSPSGCIKNIQDKAKSLYSVKNAFVLVNGSTCGILASIRALTHKNDKVIVARNCHISVYNAIELCSLSPVYIIPKVLDEYGINSSVSPLDVENALINNPDASLVILTSPTYEGVTSDIKSISKICHNYGARLFVDEAHGAHFPFSERFPDEAVKCGADAAAASLHKTLPSLTQTALLLTNDDELCIPLQNNLDVFETSSPSYILMASVENCLDCVSQNQDSFVGYTDLLDNFYSRTKNLKKLKLLYNDKIARSQLFDYDFGKILISTSNTNINGKALSKILREKYMLETEMAYTDYVLAMTSVCDTSEGFDRLANALCEIDKTLFKACTKNTFANISLQKKMFEPSNRFDYPSALSPLSGCENKISLEYVFAYPPGIPLIVPGEVISKETIDLIVSLKENDVDVFTSKKNPSDLISVLKTD